MPSIASTARASSDRPCVTSQRGLKGVKNRRKKNAAAGNASTPNIQRHSIAPRSSCAITKFEKNARRMPNTILNCVIATRRPRYRAGDISAMYIGETTEAPPTAMPPMKRKNMNEYQSQANPLPTAETK